MRNFFHTAVLAVFLISSFIFQPVMVFAAAPTAQNLSMSLNEDASRSVTLRATSTVRNETMTYAIVGSPTHGSVSLSNTTATYTPTANYYGQDSFTYRATGATSGVSNTATVSISVSSSNDSPVANATTATTTKNVPVTFQLSGTDVDGDRLTCSAVSAMAGTFSVNSSTCMGTFTPANNATGTGYAYFKVNDGSRSSPSAIATITIQATNTAPTAQNVSLSVNEDATGNARLSATDSDNDALTFSVVTAPIHGTVTISGTSAMYLPAENYAGTDSFTYKASDGQTVSNTATVSVTVNAINDVPVADPVTASTDNVTPITITLAGSDVDGDALTYQIMGFPSSGTTSNLNGNQVTYTPTSSFVGVATFTYQVNDGRRAESGVVSITIDSVPFAYPLVVATVTGESVSILPAGGDLDGNTYILTLATEPEHGTLTSSTGGWRYWPDVGFEGMDTFTYQANDGGGTSLPATVRINVHPESGVDNLRIAQAGINLINLSAQEQGESPWLNDVIADLGVQAVRQMGAADTTWTNVMNANGVDVSQSATDVRIDAHERGIVTVQSLFQYAYGSCTPTWDDYTDPGEFVRSMSAECTAYLSLASEAIEESNPEGGPVYVEVGNELFHWIAYDSTINYTPEQQAAVIAATSSLIRANVPNAYIVAPSVMFSNNVTEEWQERVFDEIGTDWFDLHNIHFYERWESIRPQVEDYYENMAVPGKLWSVTETGRSSDPTATRTEDNTEEKKVAAIAQNFSQLWGAGASSVYWHAFIEGDGNTNDFRGMGLVDAETGEYLLAAYAYRLLTSELVPFDQITDLTVEDSDTYAYQYNNYENDTMKQVVWGSGAYIIPEGITRMTSFFPSPDGSYTYTNVSAGQTITLEDTPVLLK